MDPDGKDQVREDLSVKRTEPPAAMGETCQSPDINPPANITAPINLDASSPGGAPTILATPTPGGSVTVGVAGADVTSSDGGIDPSASPCDGHPSRTQLRINLPEDYAQALSRVPGRYRTRMFVAAVFGPMGSAIRPDEFLAAAIQLERSGNILRQVRHLGLPVGCLDGVDKLCRWIGRVCNLRRDNRVSYSPRLSEAQAHALEVLKPRERDEFVRFALSVSRAGISHNRLVSQDFWIRMACDSITWNLDGAPTVVPVAEVLQLIVVLETLREGGAP